MGLTFIAAFFPVLKFVVVGVLLSAMVGVLVGIRALYAPEADPDAAENLRRDVSERENVISRGNLFSRLVGFGGGGRRRSVRSSWGK